MATFLYTVMRKSRKLKDLCRKFSTSVVSDSAKLKVSAQLQEAALEEKCILVDELDRPIGEATKRYCHRVSKQAELPLHRAFSVFLFDERGNLLLQRRSETKITFPNCYTNTCCSHPLSDIPGENEDIIGVKRAARRRLNYELGIPKEQTSLDDYVYLTRIHYLSTGDGIWGEHEIDYVLFLRKNNLTLDPNPEEVSDLKWISKDGINDFVRTFDVPLTPWFQLLLRYKLPLWWSHLDNLDTVKDHASIHRFS